MTTTTNQPARIPQPRPAHGPSQYRPDESGPAGQPASMDCDLAMVVRQKFECGWTPLDLYEFARRNVTVDVTGHLMTVVAEQTAARRPVDPRWQRQVTALCPDIGGGSAAWARRTGRLWTVAHQELSILRTLMHAMPAIPSVLPAPGTEATSHPSERSTVDERVLRRVRALLAKAESSEFESEADALTAKAQELMTTHSIDRVIADGTRPSRPGPGVRRIWIDGPYYSAKAMLVGTVALSNNCACITMKSWQLVTVVGHAVDLDATELLSTSLLVQATRAMTSARSQLDFAGQARTRSFRQSFLLAYAGRIGERLAAATTTTRAAADAEHGGALLPVLAAREREVEAAVSELFPSARNRSSRLRISDGAGWEAGRAAADRAVLTARPHLDQRRC